MAELYGGSVLLIGLTGGIGSGKSTVSALLAEKGAVIIDADAITHELQQPGQPVFDAMVERFGKEILRSEEHTSALQSHSHIVCRLLLEKKRRPTHRADEKGVRAARVVPAQHAPAA